MSPEEASVTDLVQHCQQQTRRYRQQQASDPRYCLEIFRRAVRHGSNGPHHGDEPARTALVEIYSEYIKAQLNRQSLRMPSNEDLVQQVWLRFWQAAYHTQLEFPSLGSALSYLQRVVMSTAMEALKEQARQRSEQSLHLLMRVPGEEPLLGSSPTLFDGLARELFRERCRVVLSDQLSLRIFWLRFGLGFAPRDIARMLADEATLINERSATSRLVSDLLYSCTQRLRLDPEIRDLLSND